MKNKYCQNCNTVLTGTEKKCSSCGFRIEPQAGNYPTIADLKTTLADIFQANGLKTLEMPSDPYQAAEQWLKTIEPHKEDEGPQKRGSAWIWPYFTRCTLLAREFLRADKALQERIIAASQENIYWRGEDLQTFNRVIDEYLEMQEAGIEKYRKIAKIKLKLMNFFRAC